MQITMQFRVHNSTIFSYLPIYTTITTANFRTFGSPQKKLIVHYIWFHPSTHTPQTPQPTTDLLSVSTGLSHEWSSIIITCCLWCPVSFTHYNVYNVHSCCWMYQYDSFLCSNNIPLHGYITFCSSVCWTFWLFPGFGCYKYCSYKHPCKSFCADRHSHLSWIYIPRKETAGSYDNSVFKHWRNSLSSKMAVPFYIPASGTWGFWFLHILTRPVTVWLLDPSHPSGHEEFSLWFWFAFPSWLMMLNTF